MLKLHSSSAAPRLQPALPTREVSPLEELIGILLRAVDNAKKGLASFQEIAEARKYLDSMPLATGDYGVARNRLVNAHRYMVSGELGAAAWELANLRGGLIRLA